MRKLNKKILKNKERILTMKYINKSLLAAASLIVFMGLFAACTDHFGNLNTPPSEINTIDPGYLFTAQQRWEARGFGNYHWFYLRNVGSWAQHWGETQLNNGRATYFNSGQRRNEDQVWNGTYDTILKDLERAQSILLELSDGDEMDPAVRTRLAVTRIFEVVSWEKLTSIYGDIPFTEAVKGFEGNTTPAYDRQQDIYPALINQLDANIGRLTQGDVTYGEADLYYRGDVDKWRRFGNTLKLRTAMRVSYADPGLAQQWVTEAMSQPLMESHDHSASASTGPGGGAVFLLHGQVQHYRNPFTLFLTQRFIDELETRNDPRLPFIAEPTPNSVAAGNPEFRGLRVNVTEAEMSAFDGNKGDLSRNTFSVYRNELEYNPPMHLLTYATASFLKAEAALRGWGATPAQAQGFFQEGIRAAMEMEPYHEIDPADIDAYIDAHGTLSINFEEALEQIAIQKWINHHHQFTEAFFEWRRLSYPRLDPGNGGMGETNNTIPRRAYWHQNEVSLNAANYEAAVQSQGPNNFTTRIWIDANPSNGQSITY